MMSTWLAKLVKKLSKLVTMLEKFITRATHVLNIRSDGICSCLSLVSSHIVWLIEMQARVKENSVNEYNRGFRNLSKHRHILN